MQSLTSFVVETRSQEDALRLATEGEDLRQELRRGEERVTSLQDQVGDLLEANRVLRGVNAELEAQVEEADRQADAAQARAAVGAAVFVAGPKVCHGLRM